MHRRIIDIFFLYMIFEGLARKLWLSSLSIEIQIIRDLLPSLALIAYLTSNHAVVISWKRSVIGATLALYVLIGAVQFFNPRLLDPLIGVLGLRTHFAYVPILILAPTYIRTYDQLIKRLIALSLIIVPVAALGVVQTHLPASHPLNAQMDATFGTAGLVRASGTFSYITGFGVLCQFSVVAAMVLLVLKPIFSPAGLIGVAGAAFGFIGCLSSGSRAPVFGSALQLGILALLLLWSRAGGRVRLAVWRIIMVGIAVGLIALTRVPDVYEAFRERTMATAFDVDSRLVGGTFGWLAVLADYPFGNGIGMAHQQAGTLVGMAAGFLSGYESELSRIAYELGIPGFAAFMMFRVSLLIRVGTGMRAVSEPVQASVAALSFSTMALMIQGGVYTPMANALLYLMAGMGLAAVGYRKVQSIDRVRPPHIVPSPLTSVTSSPR